MKLPLAFCIYCEVVIRRDSDLCAQCWIALQRNTEKGIQGQCRYLLNWQRDQTPYVSQLIQHLKAGNHLKTWRQLADHFVKLHFPQVVNLIQESIIVPVPSKRQTQEDHAWQWALALSAATGIPIVYGENFSFSRKAQKAQNRIGRLQMEMKGNIEVPTSSRRVIIADDILTTGATAQGLLQVIDSQARPRKAPDLEHEIWVVAYRSQI